MNTGGVRMTFFSPWISCWGMVVKQLFQGRTYNLTVSTHCDPESSLLEVKETIYHHRQ